MRAQLSSSAANHMSISASARDIKVYIEKTRLAEKNERADMRSFICGFFARQHLWFGESNAVWQYLHKSEILFTSKSVSLSFLQKRKFNSIAPCFNLKQIFIELLRQSYASLTLHFVCCNLLKVYFLNFSELSLLSVGKLSSSLLRKLPTKRTHQICYDI